MLAELDMRQKARKLSMEPPNPKSNVLKLEPHCSLLKSEIADPRRWNVRIEKQLPAFAKFKAETFCPSLSCE
jgi:hypothetical protein